MNKAYDLLVIDPNLSHHYLLNEQLEKAHFRNTIVFVEKLSAASQVLKKKKVDLIITELDFEDQSGVPYLKSLKKKAESTPILILTQRRDENKMAEYISHGAEDYILKTKSSLKAIDKIIQRFIIKSQNSSHHFISEKISKIPEKIIEELTQVKAVMKKFSTSSNTKSKKSKNLENAIAQVQAIRDSFNKIIKNF
jgi:DNA-binding response OmpR family regulator